MTNPEDLKPAVYELGARFMIDMATYVRGAELGFSGLDFYVRGRGGVLGEAPADVVVAAFGIFEPAHLAAEWTKGSAVMPAGAAAREFARCIEPLAERVLPAESTVAARSFTALASRVIDAAPVAGAPLFAGWRQLPVPSEPRAAALHQLNALREMRFGPHLGALTASSLTMRQAVSVGDARMAAIQGWTDLDVDVEPLRAEWQGVEAATVAAFARRFAVLDDAELSTLVGSARELVDAASSAEFAPPRRGET